MADLRVQSEVDELAVAMVQALAEQDGDRAMAIGVELAPLVQDRPAMLARHVSWMAQAHYLRGEYCTALSGVARALEMAEAVGDLDALPILRQLQAVVTAAEQAAAHAQALPLPDTPVGRALAAIDAGDLAQGAKLARAARETAKADEDAREEVLALLALARIPDEAASAILAAHAVADRAQDKNLVTAVSRAATAVGIDLPTHVF